MPIRFDLTDMQLFINIGDSSSLTRGAEKSHLSASAASIRIKNLEDGFRTRLLYRTNQGVTLTPAGEALKQHRSEENTSELQSLMRISYAVFFLKTKNNTQHDTK